MKVVLKNLNDTSKQFRLIPSTYATANLGSQTGAIALSDGIVNICLAPKPNEISCDGANEQVSINVSLSWQGESGGAITVYNDETNEIISEIQGYYLDLPDYNMANETSPQIEYISTIAETSSSSTEYENYRTTQQLITYRNKSSAPIRLRIEILNYEQDRFPKTFIGEETEFHHNPTFGLIEETSQRVVYGVCLSPKVEVIVCEPTILPMLTQEIPASDTLYYSYRINGGAIVTETTSAGAGYLAQQVFVNTIAYQWRHPLSDLFGSEGWKQSAFLATYTTPIQGASADAPNVVSTVANTVEFLLTPDVEDDLIKIIFGESITLHSCAIRTWD